MRDPEPETIEQRLEGLYGRVDWARQEGLLQVVAIAASPRVVIALGPTAPESDTDRFVLGVARARADLVLTSGAILRAEPGLVHRFSDDPEQDRALQHWRRERLGRPRPPGLGILSRSGQMPADHPALRFASAGFIWTSRAGRARLGGRVGALEVVDAVGDRSSGSGHRGSSGPVPLRAPGLGGAIAHARSSGARTVLVEAGPSLARALHSGPRRPDAMQDAPGEAAAPLEQTLDELLLSCFGGALDPSAVGPAFVSESAIRASFPDPPSERGVEEPSGSWRFLRYRRRSTREQGIQEAAS